MKQSVLMKRIAGCVNLAVSGDLIIYRNCSPKYATEKDLLSGEGSKKVGGRWNPVGIAAVYGCLDLETVLAEFQRRSQYSQIPPYRLLPRTLVSIQAELQCMLPLINGGIRQRIGVSKEKMITSDWMTKSLGYEGSLTQNIGLASYEAGFEAILVPSSSRKQGVNLVIFPDNIRKGSNIDIINVERL